MLFSHAFVAAPEGELLTISRQHEKQDKTLIDKPGRFTEIRGCKYYGPAMISPAQQVVHLTLTWWGQGEPPLRVFDWRSRSWTS